MNSFRKRHPVITGAGGVAMLLGLVIGSFNFKSLPFIFSDITYSAYFDEAGGLTTGAPVQVSGLRAGQVKSISLKPQGVLVEFTVPEDIRLGARTEAAIKTIGLLGNKILAVTPRGDGRLAEVIPIERTTSPYQLPDAVGDLTATISGLNTDQLSSSLKTLSETLRDTPPDLKLAVDGIARFSETLGTRDEHLRALLSNARKATAVLAERGDEIAGLVQDTNALLAELRAQSGALDQISGNLSAMVHQIRGLIAEQRDALKPALDKLNGVLTIIDNRKAEVQESLKGLNSFILGLGEAVSGGPFFKAYIANLLPGQFVQPFVDAAFSDLGVDPNVLTPSERHDPQTGQPGTPALPVPYPRTGQGGEPRMTLPEAITGNPGDQGCGPPGVPLPGPTGCYPYREPLPAPPPGGPPPGPPALAPDDQQHAPQPPNSSFAPASGERGVPVTGTSSADGGGQ
ncbi:MCE family protein [Mycolicibacterium novocastrense]|uniref:MCE family protein n=1 Tax=Mycolicibacterium novocastrense TaxID=59813 RepID=UPI000A7F6BB2|nr:MCE family protein [Mycolicibacterium novocastrense]